VKAESRLLIAAQPAISLVLKSMLESFELTHASTTAQAFDALAQSKVDLIVCTIAFDDSRMLEFLQAVKRSASLREIPFICCRVLPSVLPDELVAGVGATCRQCGAAFLDIARMGSHEAGRSLRNAITALLESHAQGET
jgi:CheY-like chemotaxis protein